MRNLLRSHRGVKRLLQHAAGFVLGHFPDKSPSLFRVLTLHHISDLHDLDRLIRHLVETYDVITPQVAQELIRGSAASSSGGKPRYLVTFDDGFRSQVRAATEVLGIFGLKAVFFVCPDIMDSPPETQRSLVASNYFDPPIPDSRITDGQLPMTWREAEALVKAGHVIGSHTCSHARLHGLDSAALSHELLDSASRIEMTLRVKPAWFAFPFGDLKSIESASFRLADRNYPICCSNIPARNTAESAAYIVFRMGVDLRSPLAYQRMVLAGGLDMRSSGEARILLDMCLRARADA